MFYPKYFNACNWGVGWENLYFFLTLGLKVWENKMYLTQIITVYEKLHRILHFCLLSVCEFFPLLSFPCECVLILHLIPNIFAGILYINCLTIAQFFCNLLDWSLPDWFSNSRHEAVCWITFIIHTSSLFEFLCVFCSSVNIKIKFE